MDQYTLGWPRLWDRLFPDVVKSAVRITEKHKSKCVGLSTDGTPLNCYLSGNMLHQSTTGGELPSVGDWCTTRDAFVDRSDAQSVVVDKILTRRTSISRKSAGARSDVQTLVANVDTAFIVTSANTDFNVNRLRRYVLLAEHGYVRPVVVISKADAGCDDAFEMRNEITREFPELEIIATSARDRIGLNEILDIVSPGQTAVFLGSSGVGKSSLVNAILGYERQTTREIRESDERGMHTTTGSELLFIPGAGMIIDTPGLREVGLIVDQEELDQFMPSVQTLSAKCKFADCIHETEPGCAVQSALETGELSEDDYAQYIKLQKEAAYNRRRMERRAAVEEQMRWKKITMENRRRYKERG